MNGFAIRKFPGKGRGLVATRAFAQGELIATCPTFELSPEEVRRIDETSFHNHHFSHPELDDAGLIALGPLTLTNHAPEPNAGWDYRDDPDAGWLIDLTAKRQIEPGEEITIDYNCELWFEYRG